jgi:RimJ/RimL family protein N-acetyltransferase
MELRVLSMADCEQIRLWRNEQLEILRTPFLLTEEMQEDFYINVVCDRNARARYWGVWNTYKTALDEYEEFIGMVGLENISLENRNAEISLLLAPDKWDKFGPAFLMVLEKGFFELNLENLYAEVYACNSHISQWKEVNDERIKIKKEITILTGRKYWRGKYYDSIYLNFNRGDYIYENTTAQ